ncbi:MAG: GtrA family protein [Myxococcota bacterium]|nr:GtrA family protein [Myxococcota bacterium]
MLAFTFVGFLKRLQRRTLLRSALTSAVATASDFAAAHALHGMEVPATNATVLGCAVGGVVAFSLNRYWAFHAREGRKRTQVLRFLAVWATSALLNAAGVGLLLLPGGGHFTYAWLVTRGAVYLGWNYPLLRWFVFRRRAPTTR